MNPVDAIVLVLMVVAVFLGVRSGAIPQLAGLGGAALGAGAGFLILPAATPALDGLVPTLRSIVVEPEKLRQLFELVQTDPDVELQIDLDAQVVHLPGDEDLPFDVDPFAKLMLLRGTDEMGYLLDHVPAIETWESGHPARVDTRPTA